MKSKIRRLMVGIGIIGVGFLPTSVVNAQVVFQNAPAFDNIGSCVFNAACGGSFAAQEFTLTNSATLTSASFFDLTLDANFLLNVKEPTSVNWLILAANGAGGLPGTVITSGSNDPITASQFQGYNTNYPYYQESFALPAIALPAGSYYLGFEALGSDYGVYLTQGLLPSGGATGFGSAQSLQWVSTYAAIPSVAVTIDGNSGATGVPEPPLFDLMGLAFGVMAVAVACRRSPGGVGLRLRGRLLDRQPLPA